MSVRISVTLVVEDGVTIEDLKGWVRDGDEIASGTGNGITYENVKPSDVLTNLIVHSGLTFEVVDESMEEL